MTLTDVLTSSLVLVDTCALMNDDADDAFDAGTLDALRSAGVALTVPAQVVQELQHHARHPGERRDRAMAALQVLNRMRAHEVLDVRGAVASRIADNEILGTVMRYRDQRPTAVITLDVGLSVDLLDLRQSHSVDRVQPIHVIELRDSALALADPTTLRRRRHAQLARKASQVDVSVVYPVATTVSALSNEPVGGVDVPGTGATVADDGGTRLALGNVLGRGGEGTVYTVDGRDDVVAKVYHPTSITPRQLHRIDRMLEVGLDTEHPWARHICWPTSRLHDGFGRVVGILMPRAGGHDLGRSVFRHTELQKHFGDWDRRQLAQLGLTLLDGFDFLHQSGVLVGDVNPNNIRVISPTEVRFIDCDSYQLEDLPCPVGTVHFTPPRLQGVEMSNVLRTLDDECFAIATLLFMLLHFGKAPYAQQGGGTPSENIRTRNFPWRLGDQYDGLAPEGPWKFIWSNLSYKLKEAFFQSFDASYQGDPITVRDLRFVLSRYLHTLDNGHVTRDLFPETYKGISNHAREKYGTGTPTGSPTVPSAAGTTDASEAAAPTGRPWLARGPAAPDPHASPEPAAWDPDAPSPTPKRQRTRDRIVSRLNPFRSKP